MTDRATEYLYAPVHREEPVVQPASRIPIHICVIDPDKWPVAYYNRMSRQFGAVNYVIPEPCDEQRLRDVLHAMIEENIALTPPRAPAGIRHGASGELLFTKLYDGWIRDDLYALGFNPILSKPGVGTVVWGQQFISIAGVLESIILRSNTVNPEFLKLIKGS